MYQVAEFSKLKSFLALPLECSKNDKTVTRRKYQLLTSIHFGFCSLLTPPGGLVAGARLPQSNIFDTVNNSISSSVEPRRRIHATGSVPKFVDPENVLATTKEVKSVIRKINILAKI
ncbi:hypothetical protein ACFE04_011130 [Oxalis oulophora]